MDGFEGNPAGLKKVIDDMPTQTLVKDQLGGKDASAFAGKKWDDLYASNDLEAVRTQFPDLYEQLRKEKYPNA